MVRLGSIKREEGKREEGGEERKRAKKERERVENGVRNGGF